MNRIRHCRVTNIPPKFHKIENVRISCSNNFNHSFDGSIIEANCSAQLNFTVPTRYRITYLIISSTSLSRILVCSKTGPNDRSLHPSPVPTSSSPLPFDRKDSSANHLLLRQQLGRGGNDPRARARSKAKETPSLKSAVNHAVATRSTGGMAITVLGLEKKIEARAFNFKSSSTLVLADHPLLFDESTSWKRN